MKSLSCCSQYIKFITRKSSSSIKPSLNETYISISGSQCFALYTSNNQSSKKSVAQNLENATSVLNQRNTYLRRNANINSIAKINIEHSFFHLLNPCKNTRCYSAASAHITSAPHTLAEAERSKNNKIKIPSETVSPELSQKHAESSLTKALSKDLKGKRKSKEKNPTFAYAEKALEKSRSGENKEGSYAPRKRYYWTRAEYVVLIHLVHKQLMHDKRVNQHYLSLKLHRSVRSIAQQISKLQLLTRFNVGQYPDLNDSEYSVDKAFQEIDASVNQRRGFAKKYPKEFTDIEHATAHLKALSSKFAATERHKLRDLSDIKKSNSWTRAETEYLREYLEYFDFKTADFTLLQSVLYRTHGAVRNKLYSITYSSTAIGGRWSELEVDLLRTAVSIYGQYSWLSIANYVKTRDQFQCRQRWLYMNQLGEFDTPISKKKLPVPSFDLEGGSDLEDGASKPKINSTSFSADKALDSSKRDKLVSSDLPQEGTFATDNSAKAVNNERKASGSSYNSASLYFDLDFDSIDLSDLDSLIENSDIDKIKQKCDLNSNSKIPSQNCLSQIYRHNSIFDAYSKKSGPLDSSIDELAEEQGLAKSSGFLQDGGSVIDSQKPERPLIRINNPRRWWTVPEDIQLVHLVEKHQRQWTKIASEFKANLVSTIRVFVRYNKLVCCNIFMRINKKIIWDNNNDILLLREQLIHGSDWIAISQHFNNITPTQCQLRWHLLVYLSCYAITAVNDPTHSENPSYVIELNTAEKEKVVSRIQRLVKVASNSTTQVAPNGKIAYKINAETRSYILKLGKKFFDDPSFLVKAETKSQQNAAISHWSPSEDKRLNQVVNDLRNDKSKVFTWKNVSLMMTNRSSSQCRYRWVNYVSDSLNTDPWSEVEDMRLFQCALVQRKIQEIYKKKAIDGGSLIFYNKPPESFIEKLSSSIIYGSKYKIPWEWITRELGPGRPPLAVRTRFLTIERVLDILEKLGVYPKLQIGNKDQFELLPEDEEKFKLAWGAWIKYRSGDYQYYKTALLDVLYSKFSARK